MLLQLDKQEVTKIVDEATTGNWLPFGVVIFLLGIVIALILYIMNMYKAQNDKKHSETEEMMKSLTESNLRMDRLLIIHDKDIEQLQKDVA